MPETQPMSSPSDNMDRFLDRGQATADDLRPLRDQAREQKSLLDTILDSMDAHVYIKDANGCMLYVNRRVAETFGRTAESIIGKLDTEVMPLEAVETHRVLDRRVFESKERQVGEESFVGSDGQMHHYWAVKVPWQCADGTPALIGVNTDITELSNLREQLREEARTDSLTGAPNLRSFVEHAEYEFTHCHRHDIPLTIIALDVDHFKAVNDRYGHPIGDTVLKDLVACGRSALRDEDLFARTGGEEFAVLLPGTSIDTGAAVAERIRSLVAERTVSAQHPELRVTASLGVATLRHDDPNFEMLSSRADRALYLAKQARDQVRLLR
ncbi:MAG: GGDEF domain-containing protein [Castellaniella sp.]|uniref:sensor domain-containing diguanylate cyclase n=1 Tax=Castellaniella sp. TaxID=1955812 RepID=UPI001217F751|nr:GGDEF domain-containing protein [Castellaniella sp.]TAN30176.1 MAG: GGDEF domain-containing protein [Castellaniella sp.]